MGDSVRAPHLDEDPATGRERSPRREPVPVGAALVAFGVLGLLVAAVLLSRAGSPLAVPTQGVVLATLLVLLVAWEHARAVHRLTHSELVRARSQVYETERRLDQDEDTLHELRTAMAGLLLSERLLQEHGDTLEAATRSRLEELRARDLDRIDGLLAHGLPASAAGLDLPAPPLDPAGHELALGSVVDDAVAAARLRGQRVTWTGSAQQVLGHHHHIGDIGEILDILLSNAARHAPGAQVEVDVRRSGTDVLVRVHDEGPGVTPDLRPSLFQRGVKAATSPGDGIGLSLARRLATRCGGELHLEDRGPGSTFTLTLVPAPVGAASLPLNTSPLSQEDRSPCHVHSA